MEKKKATFSISQETLLLLDVYAKENATNKSALVEKLLRNFLLSKNTGEVNV